MKALREILDLLERAASLAEQVGIREAVVVRALLASITKIEATSAEIIINDRRPDPDDKDKHHG